MKWIGQHIYDQISRFRSDVYLEDISTGTIASGGNLGLDSNNKIVKATETTGDLTSIVAGTGLSGTSLTGPIPTLNVDASQTQITAVGIIGTGQWRGDVINATYLEGQSGTNTGDETLASINALDITEVGTIDSGVWNGTAIATDQQKHLAYFDFEGYGTHDGTNYEIPEIMSDNKAPFLHDTSSGSDGLTALTPTVLLRAGGHVMPYAGTLKKWLGWASSSGSGTTYVSLFRFRPDTTSTSTVSLVLLDAQSFTAGGTDALKAISQTVFTDADVAVGDIIITAIKGVSSKTTYFTSTLEVEWD